MARWRGNESESEAESRSLWAASGLGLELVGAVAGMSLVGWLIDRWQGTSPMWVLILMGVGIVGGSYNFVRQAMALNRKASAAYRARRAARGPEDPGEPVAPRRQARGMFERTEGRWDDDGDDADPIREGDQPGLGSGGRSGPPGA